METVLIQAQIRNEQLKGSNNRFRKTGLVPGVLYGKGMGNTSVLVPEKEMGMIIDRKGANAFIKISIGGSQEYNVIIKDVQRHPYKGTLTHLDFYQVSMSEKINTVVPVALVGESLGAAEGGLIQQQLREISILCLPADIPGSIEIDITNLKIGDNITASDVNVPDKVEIAEEPNTVIVSVLAPRVSTGTEEAPETDAEVEAGEAEQAAAEEVPEAEKAE